MAHDVFISYSSEDKLAADALCGALEAARIRCWVAPRDVVPALSYSGQITRAIKASRVMVLIFSEHSNVSAAVLAEVELAANAGVHILNFRVDASPLSDDLRFYLQHRHWLDALTPPMERHHARLVPTIQGLLAPASTSEEAELATPTLASPMVLPRKTGGSKARKFPLLRILLLVALVVGGTTAILKWMAGHSSAPQPAPTLAPTPTALIAGKSSPIATPESSPTIQKVDVPSTNIDKPTLLTSNEIRGNGVGEDISYYYTFNAGPGTVKVTVDGKNKPGGLTNAIGVEISDLDAKRLLYIGMGNTTIDKRKVERFQLGRRQQVIMRILLDERTLDYMVRLEGPIDFSPATKVQGPQ
jgi:TIR domain-containing protein